jgi:hypothetical protein
MRLMLMGLRSVWHNRGYNLRSKIFHIVWFPLAALLPQAAAARVIRLGVMPGRPKRLAEASAVSQIASDSTSRVASGEAGRPIK